jgi:hypothetical protein
MLLLLVILSVSATMGQTTAPTYIRTIRYVNSNCQGDQMVIRATQASCTAGTIINACSAGVVTDCYSGVPPSFGGSVQLTLYPTNACSGNPSELISFINYLCVQFLGTSYTAGCYGSGISLVYFTNTNVCIGQGYYSEFKGNQCIPTPASVVPFNLTNSGYMFATCTGVCFHESSEITYENKPLTLTSLEAGDRKGECHVPHVVQSSGVSIETSCSKSPLRVTNDHLVYTSSGLRPAASVRKGDVLYSDIEEKHTCVVNAIKGEANQKYFALNCRNSEVLANGVKTSVFGYTHSIPAFWMKYASAIMGVERASRLGDAVASFLGRWNLLR